MKMNKSIYTMCLVFITFVVGQTQVSDTIPKISDPSVLAGIPDENIDVIKAFRAKLADVSRVNISPTLAPPEPVTKDYRYNISIVPLELRYPEPIIKPLAINPDKPKPYFSFYAKAGYGTLKSIYGDIGIYGKIDQLYDFGLLIRHHSLDNSENQTYQSYNTSGFDTYLNYRFMENHQIGLKVNGQFDNRHFYYTSLKIDSLYTEEESHRSLTSLGGSISFSNTELTDLDLNYSLNIGADVFKLTNDDNRETQLTFGGKIQKVRSENVAIEMGLNAEFTIGEEYNIKVYEANPALVFNTGKFMARLGGSFLYANEKAIPWVDVELAFGVSGNFIQVYAGSNQGYVVNGLRSQAKINPYVGNISMPILANVFKDIYAGVRGEYGVLAYGIKGGYKQIDNQIFFIQSDDRRKFIAVYDDMNVPYLSGNIEFQVKDNIHVGGWATQNIYDPSFLEEAFHLPSLELGAHGKISIWKEKLSLKSTLHLADKSTYLTPEATVEKLNLLTDLNAELNIRIIENVGIWAQANNILDNKYQRWEGYPTVGINYMAGVLVKF